MNKKGFTLIELLIVIVILGILATAVLSAINPLEQIKKARDSSKKSDAAELLNAIERYYTTFGCYPWARSTGSCVTTYTAPVKADPSTATWLLASGAYSLITMQELKPEFANRSNLALLFVTENSATSLVYICYDPESKTFDAQAPYTTAGDGTRGTVGAAGNYVCVPE